MEISMQIPERNSNNRLLILHPEDNIAVLKRPTESGTEQIVDGRAVTVATPLTMGHKIAIRPISKGEDVLKYGAPIGFASEDIKAGEHVHLHNLTSRYTVIEDMEADKNE